MEVTMANTTCWYIHIKGAAISVHLIMLLEDLHYPHPCSITRIAENEYVGVIPPKIKQKADWKSFPKSCYWMHPVRDPLIYHEK